MVTALADDGHLQDFGFVLPNCSSAAKIGCTIALTEETALPIITHGKRAELARGAESAVTGRNLITNLVLISLPIIGSASRAGGQNR